MPKGKGAVRLTTSITNSLLWEEFGRYAGVVDMEMIRTSLDLQYGVHPRLELGIALSFAHAYSGIMDDAILDVEAFFGNSRDVREKQVPDRYAYPIAKDNRSFIGGEKMICPEHHSSS